MSEAKYYLLCIFFLLCSNLAQAEPTKTQFEQERKVLLRRIKNIQRILAQTARKKKTNMGQLAALNRQIEANALLISAISNEIKRLDHELGQLQRDIAMLTQDLAQLQKEYATMVYVGAKSMHDMHILAFIFSAHSFHKLVQRLQYVKQYAQMRQRHFKEIQQVVNTLQVRQTAADQRKAVKHNLLGTKQEEKKKLLALRQQQTQLLGTLSQQHDQLAKELQQRNQAVKRLDKLITDIVQQEVLATEEAAPTLPQTQPQPTPKSPQKQPKKPTPKTAQRSTNAQLTARFKRQQGKLPWPVQKGFISSKFGIAPHPVLRYVQVENLGVEIQTQPGAQALTIFEGVVKTVAFVPGMQRVVIIQHGDYHSVYARLQNTCVKVGQHVAAQTPLGTIYTNKNGITELQLQVWKRTQKLNPARWIKKP